MDLTVNVDLSQVMDRLRAIPIKARKVSAKILKSAAYDINADIKQSMKNTFKDGAKPYSLQSFKVIEAKEDALESRVELRTDAPSKGTPYNKALGHLFNGGTRAWKRMEGAFLKIGVLPPGYIIVPGDACPLDQFGNVPTGFITQILSYFNANELKLGSKGNMNEKGRKKFLKEKTSKAGEKTQYFISRGKGNWFGGRSWQNGREQHLPMGIWKRSDFAAGSAAKPILMFVRQGTYGKAIDLEQIVKTYQDTRFNAMAGRYLKSIVEA